MHKYISVPLIGIIALCSCNGNKAKQEAENIDTIPILVTQIKKHSRLYTTEYRLHKIITHRDNKQIKGSVLSRDFTINLPLSHRNIAIPLDATVKAYIDFGDFSAGNVRRDGDNIEIILPDPHIMLTSTRVNHQEIKEYVSVLRGNFSDGELSSFEKQGRQSIINNMPGMGIIDHAKESAARVLVPIIKQMGYEEENITVTFRKDFTPGDYNILLDNSLEHAK